MCQLYGKIFIVRPASAGRPSSVADNMRGRYHTTAGYDMQKLKKNYYGIGTPFTLHLIMMNLHYIEEKIIILLTFSNIYLARLHVRIHFWSRLIITRKP